MIVLKRVYERPSSDDGFRILVDRLWPRGVSKEEAKLDIWLKDIAPSDELRKWFNHDPEKWEEFKKKYIAELHDNNKFSEFKELVHTHRKVTLLFGAHDMQHNQAVVLQSLLK
ncbi:MAG TPA: DUF488 domain-containing protein [Candidatus Levybacteria bacterium]|nr:DUF488 domain-containing protein [Candidatus Levybacteria bacterium]